MRLPDTDKNTSNNTIVVPADDATPGTGAVVVLSYHFWQQKETLSADPLPSTSMTLRVHGGLRVSLATPKLADFEI